MKKKVYFHGTSADNLEDILKNGLQINTEKIWNCSCNEIYLWSVDELAEANGCEDDDRQSKEERAFQLAFESAQFALSTSKDCRAVVIRIELKSEVEPDESAPNMRGSGAVCYLDNISPHCFTSIKISDDLSLFKGAFIGMLMDHEYSNVSFNEMEQKAGECFKNNEDITLYLIEELPYRINWEEVSLKN